VSDAKVEDLDDAIGGDHQVRRLHIAVDDPVAMRLGEAARHLRRDADGFRRRQRAALEAALEGLAVITGHRDVVLAHGGLAGLVDGADVGMVERRRRPCLVQEPRRGPGRSHPGRRQVLECHLAPQPKVFGAVDNPHATPPQEVEQAVVRIAVAGAFRLGMAPRRDRRGLVVERVGTHLNLLS
jgi:hypothetical protein